jgi:hypothetical protein
LYQLVYYCFFSFLKNEIYRFENAFVGVIINAISEREVDCIVLALAGTNVLKMPQIISLPHTHKQKYHHIHHHHQQQQNTHTQHLICSHSELCWK